MMLLIDFIIKIYVIVGMNALIVKVWDFDVIYFVNDAIYLSYVLMIND